ncbi:MAG: prolipoprotein diacylglyceryl transferase [Bacillota bacterium]|nr:prolipoprotein diacylglyceryl transferase [Bacillota bacterium]
MVLVLPPLFPLPDFVNLYGSLGMQTFPLMALAGFLLAYLLLPFFLRDASPEDKGRLGQSSFWIFLFALLGARLLEQVVQPDMALFRPLTWLRFGGYSLSLVGGLLGAFGVALWKRLSPDILDRLMPPLAWDWPWGLWPFRGWAPPPMCPGP